MADVSEIAENIYMIDNELYSIPRFGSTYLLNEEKKALIDIGPTTSVGPVIAGIKKLGLRPEEIDYIIATHIHLDHAGGAGTILKDMPRAQVLAHYRGARHLINPSRLISSMVEIQGEESRIRNGEMVPVDESRVKLIHDGDILELSEQQTLRFMDAPGHAPHELCILESRHGGVFVGDAVGNYVVGRNILEPITPPPAFDFDLFTNTLRNLMKLKATAIYYAHFGASYRVQEELQLATDKLQARQDIIVQGAARDGFDQAAAEIVTQARAVLEPLRRENRLLYDYWADISIPMSAVGHIKYYKEKHKLN